MYSYSTSASPSSVSAPIPLANFVPGAAFPTPLPASAAAAAFPVMSRQPSAGSNSSMIPMPNSRYDAYQPSPLSASSLEQEVYRGVYHAAEPTMFDSRTQQRSNLWAQQDEAAFTHQQNSKKLELAFPTAFSAVPFAAPVPAQPAFEFASVPSHVERFTSFYSSAVPAHILKALRIGFQTLGDIRVDFAEDSQDGTPKGKFRCQGFTDDNESFQFIARVYKTAHAAPAPFLVEFQRRSGDSVAFFRLFQKMLKSCAAIHHGPYETSFAVAGMQLSPLPAALPISPLSSSLAPPSLGALRLDLPAVSSLCNMVASDCLESKRESAKCLAKVAQQSSLFPTPPPPTLERQQSTPEAVAASKAIWSAIVNILTTGDAECAHLGASILRTCLQKGDAPMLLEHLETDRAVVAHLVHRLAEEDTAETPLSSREIKRQVASVLSILASKKGQAHLNSLVPGATEILLRFQSLQQQ